VNILVDALMGRIRGCSFGFQRIDYEIVRYGGVMCNRLKRFLLKEVTLSKTTHPLHRSAITNIEILDHELGKEVQRRIKELKKHGEEVSKYYM
jgi:phage head maturation protease